MGKAIESPLAALSLRVRVRSGKEPTLLLLHGLLGSGESWRRLAPLLSGRQLVMPDLLGFGESPKPMVRYGLDDHCGALGPIVERAAPAVVVGHSMGAVVALGLLRRYPAIRRGVLLSPPLFRSRGEAVSALKGAPAQHRLMLRSPRVARALCAVSCSTRPILRKVAPLFARGLPPPVARAGLDHTWTSYSRSLDQLVLSGIAIELLAEVGGRTVIIHGDRDATVPLSSVLPFRDRVARILTIDGDHAAILTNPAIVAAAVDAAISDV